MWINLAKGQISPMFPPDMGYSGDGYSLYAVVDLLRYPPVTVEKPG